MDDYLIKKIAQFVVRMFSYCFVVVFQSNETNICVLIYCYHVSLRSYEFYLFVIDIGVNKIYHFFSV